MKKLLVIASLISSCILLFSCEKEPVDISVKTNGLDLNLFGGAGWCKPAATPGASATHTNQQTNTTVGLHPGTGIPKKVNSISDPFFIRTLFNQRKNDLSGRYQK